MFNMVKFKLILITCFLSLHKNGECREKLNVQVLYESLCPDSIKFIKNQLYPVWKELSPYVNIKFVPFGKSSSVENGAEFVCQHGPKECVGNRIQSCALNGIEDQDVQVEYVHCFMNIFKKEQHNGKEFGQSCAANVGINWEYITQCHDSLLGAKLQLEAEAITAPVRPKFVPTVLYNGVFNQQAQDDSQNDFRGVVCALITQIHPEACQSASVLQI